MSGLGQARRSTLHRPAHHAPGEQIDHGSHIQPALRGPDIGEVGNPAAVGSGSIKGAIQHVWSDGGRPAAHPDRAAADAGAAVP